MGSVYEPLESVSCKKSGQIRVTSHLEGSKNRILENLCERVIEIYSWENWKLGKYDPLLGLIF